MRAVVTAMLVLTVCAPTALSKKWTDSTGKYTVEAEFVDFKDGNVRLKKGDGRIINVALEKLSAVDQAYVRSEVSGGKPQRTPAKPREGDQTGDVPASQRGTTLVNKGNDVLTLWVDRKATPVELKLKPNASDHVELPPGKYAATAGTYDASGRMKSGTGTLAGVIVVKGPEEWIFREKDRFGQKAWDPEQKVASGINHAPGKPSQDEGAAPAQNISLTATTGKVGFKPFADWDLWTVRLTVNNKDTAA